METELTIMKNHILLLCTIWGSSGVSGYCQEPVNTLDFDTSRMKVSVTMDRRTYLPGEVAQISLEVSNPGPSGVVSLTPFVSATGCLYYRERIGDNLLGQLACSSVPVGPNNTTTFGPGESKRVVLNSYDAMFDLDEVVAMQGYAAAPRPGTFGITYRYGTASATAEYTVAPAKVEADTTVRVHDIMFTDHPDLVPPRAIPMYVHVIALRSEEISYICVQQHTVAQGGLIAPQSQISRGLEFTDPRFSGTSAMPLKRVATSIAPVVSLSAKADNDENLTIQWTDANGGVEKLNYPASYPARLPKQDQ
ncbi:MAG: hypothetical protein LAP87_01215 [Acidobacteriia bacterium]|nr:hypothetical protein [Terriglobia bacterium]